MANKIMETFKKQVGKVFENSPSTVANSLKALLKQAEEGHFILEVKVRPEMCNPAGTLHGGYSSMILDEVIGLATFSLNNEYLFNSVNLNVDFLRPANAGDLLLAEAKVVRQGRNIINVDGWLRHLNGKLVAKCSSNMGRIARKNPFHS